MQRKQADHFQSFWQLFPQGDAAVTLESELQCVTLTTKINFLLHFLFPRNVFSTDKSLKTTFFQIKWWKPNRTLWLQVQHLLKRHIFQDSVLTESNDPNVVIISHHWVCFVLTMWHNSISPCPNVAPRVTSTVNQGRAPLFQDKIREAWSTLEWI